MKKLLSTLLLGLIVLSMSHAENVPPNIVFLMTDDQRWDCFGCYGRPEFKTQNIDKLSSEGVTFDQAYYAVAICKPSRATVMTGRYFSSHECGFVYPYNVDIPAAHFEETYHARLKKAGYRSGFVGKFGFDVEGASETLKKHFDYWDARGRWTDSKEADEAFRTIYARDRSRKERTLKKGDSMLNFLNTQPEGKPFVLSISFDAVKNDSDDDMYGPDTEIFKSTQMTVPENWVEGDNEALPEVIKKNARGFGLHRHYCNTPEKYQILARRFATQGVTVDNQVGRLMEKLEEMGVLENTIVIYTSDNGRFHGSHGIFDKALLYEEAVKAPLIIWDGRKAGKGRREAALVSSVDFAPTILSLAGQPIPDRMQGVDLTGILNEKGDKKSWRDAVFMENLFIQEIHTAWVIASREGKEIDYDKINNNIVEKNRSYRSRGVRTAQYKYFIYYEHDPVIEELYDLKADPHEENNLVGDSAHAETLMGLRVKTDQLYNKYKKN